MASIYTGLILRFGHYYCNEQTLELNLYKLYKVV